MTEESQLRGINSRLSELTNAVKKMHASHIEIGRLFKTWLETEEVKDRPMFEVGQTVQVFDTDHVCHMRIGRIVKLDADSIAVDFGTQLDADSHTYFSARQLNILHLGTIQDANQLEIPKLVEEGPQ
jgi:hypothetical protein